MVVAPNELNSAQEFSRCPDANGDQGRMLELVRLIAVPFPKNSVYLYMLEVDVWLSDYWVRRLLYKPE